MTAYKAYKQYKISPTEVPAFKEAGYTIVSDDKKTFDVDEDKFIDMIACRIINRIDAVINRKIDEAIYGFLKDDMKETMYSRQKSKVEEMFRRELSKTAEDQLRSNTFRSELIAEASTAIAEKIIESSNAKRRMATAIINLISNEDGELK